MRSAMYYYQSNNNNHDRQQQQQQHQQQVRKADFVLALGKLGLVLTHGQSAALAARHHGDYQKFLEVLADPRRRRSEVRRLDGRRTMRARVGGVKIDIILEVANVRALLRTKEHGGGGVDEVPAI